MAILSLNLERWQVPPPTSATPYRLFEELQACLFRVSLTNRWAWLPLDTHLGEVTDTSTTDEWSQSLGPEYD